MANAHNVILTENILLTYAQPNTLERRKELISEIIRMFKENDATWFARFAATFPGNEQGQNTQDMVTHLSKLYEESPYVFHDYQQALSVAQNMMQEISKLTSESFQMFTGILSLRPRALNVNAVFDLKAENPPLANIQKFIMPSGQKAPKNFDGCAVSGFVRAKEKNFARDAALKGRFYLRTILSEVSPKDARDICTNLFMTENANPTAKTDAENILSHQAMRWSAVAIDRKKRNQLNLQFVPVPNSTYSKLEMFQGRKVDVASGLMNAGIVCSVLFALVASAIPVKNDSNATQTTTILQKTAQPRP